MVKLEFDFRITRIIDDFAEEKIIVQFELIDPNGEVFGDIQEIVFWKSHPMDVIDGEQVRPNIPHWFDMPQKYGEQMDERAKDASEAVLLFLNDKA